MAAVCNYCAVVAVAVCAIIIVSQEVHAQRWVSHAVGIAAEDFANDQRVYIVNATKMKRLDMGLMEIVVIDHKYYTEISGWTFLHPE